MGRRRQEEVTGLTYEERVKRAKENKQNGVIRFIRNIFRLNKDVPLLYANNNRKGIPYRNWNLKDEPIISVVQLKE